MKRPNIKPNNRDKKVVMLLLLFLFTTIFTIDLKGPGIIKPKPPGPKPPVEVCDTDYTLECLCQNNPNDERCDLDEGPTNTENGLITTNKPPIGNETPSDKPGEPSKPTKPTDPGKPTDPEGPVDPELEKLIVRLDIVGNLRNMLPGDAREVNLNTGIIGTDGKMANHITTYNVKYKSEVPFEYNSFDELPYELYSLQDIEYNTAHGYTVINDGTPFDGVLEAAYFDGTHYIQEVNYKLNGDVKLKGDTDVNSNDFYLTAKHEARVLEDLDIHITFTGTYK